MITYEEIPVTSVDNSKKMSTEFGHTLSVDVGSRPPWDLLGHGGG